MTTRQSRELNREQYQAMAMERLERGNLFDAPAFVVPVKTRGRWYGSLSRKIAEAGIEIPDLDLTAARAVPYNDKLIVFVALWSDDNEYTEVHVERCVHNAVLAAAPHNPALLAFPVLVGMRFMASLERGVELAEETSAALKLPVLTVSVVSNRLPV